MAWRVVATIRCGLLLQMGGKAAVPEKTECHAYIEGIRIEQPRTIPRWQATPASPEYAPASEYDVELRLNVADAQQAWKVGVPSLREAAAALSFLGSAPVEIVKVHVITDSPAGGARVVDSQGKVTRVRPTRSGGEPEPGEQYTSILYPEYKSEVPPTAVAMADTVFVGKRKPERVVRALRWIQKSYFTNNPVDEFTYLMIAFESVSEILKAAGVQYWRCGACDAEVQECPTCKESTASKMTGAAAMREFVTQTMGWTGQDWRDVWGWRGKVFHGQTDVSMDEEHAIQEHLPKLEKAVIAAVKTAMGLPADGAPKDIRHRVPFSDPYIVINWRAPETSGET
jgi:hypothetical protein